jgi:hypothetical protein
MRKHGCLGSGYAGAIALLAGDPAGQFVAQALLEKAIAIDYGQALGVLAASHTFGIHMGWADAATTAPIAERAALDCNGQGRCS